MWQPLYKQIPFLDARKKVYRTTLLGENFPSKACNEFIIISRLKRMKTVSCRHLRVNWRVLGFLKDASFLPTEARPILKLFWAQWKIEFRSLLYVWSADSAHTSRSMWGFKYKVWSTQNPKCNQPFRHRVPDRPLEAPKKRHGLWQH